MRTARFSEVTAVRPFGDGVWRAELDPRWTIAGHPNGGYLLATAARAGVAASGRSHALTASAQFLRTPEPGPVDLETEILRAGRSATHVRVRMSQDGTPCVEVLMVTGVLDDTGAPATWTSPPQAPSPDAWSDGVRIGPVTPDGAVALIMDQVVVELSPDTAGYATGSRSGRGELAGRLGLPDAESFGDYALLYAADALPPPAFDVVVAGWVPTITMSVSVRALPAPGPVYVRCRSALIDDGRVDETCTIHDSTGRLVAHGTQLSGIRLP